MASLHENNVFIGSTLHGRGVLLVSTATVILAAITANYCHTYFLVHHIEMSVLPSIFFGAVMWLWWALVAWVMWRNAHRYPISLTFSLRSVSLQLIVGCLVSYAHLHLIQWSLRVGDVWPAWQTAYAQLNYVTLSRFGLDMLNYCFLFAVSATLSMQSQRQADAIQRLALERQLSRAQLSALQMQMEPHFLFNTLNAIKSLVTQGRNDEANRTLTHLNSILRPALQRQVPEKVPFSEELRLVESYLAIQQLRFADRLTVHIHASEDARRCLVPSFILQPIVENAVQHGIAPSETGGIIETSATRVGNELFLLVRDNGLGTKTVASEGHGIGIRNTRERLAFFYPESHNLTASPIASGGFEVSIRIPYEEVPA
ncbi:sensor histidine kinase [Terriglobus roseus]|uniref:Histidine kinase n=1 Tax=Terriglobus roseus TaxID=392734 RepID=A0A1G7HFH2_9BACT|nr:histidine kinase [Terriglobus roseus]SDE98789.1 Histidine kinase [Terriglobus roseus]